MSVEASAAPAARTATFSMPMAAAIVCVGVVAFAAFLVLVTYGSDLRRGNGGADALSNSAVGFSGLVETLRLAHTPVVINRAPLPRRRSSGLMVVMPGPTDDLKAVEDLGFDGRMLVILPKWQVFPDAQHRGWVRRLVGPGAPQLPASNKGLAALTHVSGRTVAALTLQAVQAPFGAAQTLAFGPVDRIQSWTGAGWEPVLLDPAGEVLMARAPDRPIFLLADPDLMNNQGLRDERTFAGALAIVQALRPDDEPVIFDLRLSGLGRQRNPLRLLFDPPFLAVTLCLAAAGALAGWQAFARFGPPRREDRAIALGKTALVDSSAGLIGLAGREARMAPRYADLTAALAARAVGAPRTLGGAPLAHLLDRLAAQRGAAERLEDLVAEASTAKTPARAAAVAARLYRWRGTLAPAASADSH